MSTGELRDHPAGPPSGDSFRQRAWSMVASRREPADCLFVYAVRTTGIYCRPSCPSRRPRPGAVEFFATSALAEEAGYRACKRCTPQREHPRLRALTAACGYLRSHVEEPVTLAELGRMAGLSAFHVQRMFRNCLGITPRQYQQALRMESFRGQVAAGASITGAAYDAGFGSSSRLYEAANGRLGMKPGQIRKGGRGAEIGFTTVRSPLGRMLVAVTHVGLCMVAFGAGDAVLERELRTRFPEASIRRDPGRDAGLAPAVEQILSQMSEHPLAMKLPLDVRATAFQIRVWEALRKIPRGETRSYSDVARSIGKPEAVRAVARACALNMVAVAIPCHRVVGRDGSLTGYRWGVERKKKLLEMERKDGPEAVKAQPRA